MSWWGFTRVSANAMRRNLRLPYPHNALTLQPGGVAEMFYGIEHEQIVLARVGVVRFTSVHCRLGFRSPSQDRKWPG